MDAYDLRDILVFIEKKGYTYKISNQRFSVTTDGLVEYWNRHRPTTNSS